jgi:hypothetical protein
MEQSLRDLIGKNANEEFRGSMVGALLACSVPSPVTGALI